MEQAAIENLQKLAEAKVQEVLGSDDWSAWFTWNAKFWKYSFANQMLILSQKPEATKVAGFDAWMKMGRAVKKGETAIRIFAPRTVKKDRSDAKGNATDDEGGATFTYFRAVPVFDISQTEGEEPPARLEKGALGESSAAFGYFDQLRAALEDHGVAVKFRPETELGSAGGYYSPLPHPRIVVKDGLPTLDALRVLLHETAHYLGDHFKPGVTRVDAEVQAEMAAYIAAGALGFDLSAASVPYAANWGKDIAVLKKNAADVATIVKRLMELFPAA